MRLQLNEFFAFALFLLRLLPQNTENIEHLIKQKEGIKHLRAHLQQKKSSTINDCLKTFSHRALVTKEEKLMT